MKDSALVKSLHETGSYSLGPESVPRPFSRIFGRFDWWFKALVTRTVFQAAAVSRRGEMDRQEWFNSAFAMMRHVASCGGRVEATGGENMAKLDGPAVFVANHMSMLETLLLPALILPFQDVAVVVKKSLLTYPVFGITMRALDPIGVGRENPRDDLKLVLSKGRQALKNGRSVLIFPQSTRLTTFDPSRFNSLGVKLASRSGVPVLPVALKTDFLGVGKLIRDFGALNRESTVRFAFGPSSNIDGNAKEVHDQTLEFITSHLRSWGVPISGEDNDS